MSVGVKVSKWVRLAVLMHGSRYLVHRDEVKDELTVGLRGQRLLHAPACMCVCMYANWHVCMCACVYACMHVCMYACMHVCMHVAAMRAPRVEAASRTRVRARARVRVCVGSGFVLGQGRGQG